MQSLLYSESEHSRLDLTMPIKYAQEYIDIYS